MLPRWVRQPRPRVRSALRATAGVAAGRLQGRGPSRAQGVHSLRMAWPADMQCRQGRHRASPPGILRALRSATKSKSKSPPPSAWSYLKTWGLGTFFSDRTISSLHPRHMSKSVPLLFHELPYVNCLTDDHFLVRVGCVFRLPPSPTAASREMQRCNRCATLFSV